MNVKQMISLCFLAWCTLAVTPTCAQTITHVPVLSSSTGAPSAGEEFGGSVSSAGDVNGDGFADLIVGTRRDGPNGRDPGNARVFSGIDGSVLYTFNGDGASVSGAGDVNGDGFDDLIVGAPNTENNGTRSGSARVYSGVDGSVLYKFDGDSNNSQFGISVSGAGDVNGDGFADLIVGASLSDNNGRNSGSAKVFSGVDGSVLYTFDGDGDSFLSSFGESVSGAGDVNGDGFDDLIVGARGVDKNGRDINFGRARVFSGVDGSVLYNFDGDSAGDQFGESVSGAGDVNGDGFADLIVGARFDDNNAPSSGSARVLSGSDGSVLYNFDGDSAGDFLGGSVSGAGDVNGDGFDDLIVGVDRDDNNGTDSGSARVLSGSDGSVLYVFDGNSAGDQFGFSVSGAGDVNGDGIADLIVGAPRDDDSAIVSGRARVLSGSDGSVIYNFKADDIPVGDVNGDGIDDLMVGNPLDDNNGTDSGSAHVLSGSDGSVLYNFDGDSAGDMFGGSVSGAGDVNGDGFADLIVGVAGDDNNGTDSGSAQVLSGSDGSVLYNFDGDSAGDMFGFSVSGAGDVNDDGFADLIVGAPFDDNNGMDSGSARVLSGVCLLYTSPSPRDATLSRMPSSA